MLRPLVVPRCARDATTKIIHTCKHVLSLATAPGLQVITAV